MRADYFTQPRRSTGPFRARHPVWVGVLAVIKNLVGTVLVLMGLLMLITPGQGLLTLLIGMTMVNYPGKYQAERWLVNRRPVHRSINWIRARANVPPLELPDQDRVT